MKQYNSTLLSPDVDPLAMPAGAVPPPSFPCLLEDRYKLIIRSPEIAEYGTPAFKYLKFKLETTADAKTTEDRVMHAGFKFSHLEVTEETTWRTKEEIGARMALIVRAIFGPKTQMTARQIVNDPSLIDGKPVEAKVGISKAKNDRPAQNEVKTWIVPGV